MPKKPARILKRCLPGVLLAALVFQILLQIQAATPAFKSFAEAKVGELVHAKVHVRAVKVGFLNRIILKGIEISHLKDEKMLYQLQVERIVFRYNLLNILTQNFQAPSGIEFKTPSLTLSEAIFPYAFFKDLAEGSRAGLSASSVISNFEMKGGRFRCRIPGLNSEILLEDVRGVFKPVGRGVMQVHFQADIGGIVSGTLEVEGEVDYLKATHRLKLNLKSVNTTDENPLPLEAIDGEILWEGDDFVFNRLQAKVHGWESSLGGKLEDTESAPKLTVHWQIGKKKDFARIKLEANFVSQQMSGSIDLPGYFAQDFTGRIRRDKSAVLMEDLSLNQKATQGNALFDFATGQTKIAIERGLQRVSVSTNLRKLNFDLLLNFSHLKVFGADLVTQGRVQLQSRKPLGMERRWQFDGNFQTDYFILETMPLKDFAGRFEVTPLGVRNLEAGWGESFKLKGDATFHSKAPDVRLELQVTDLELGRFREFAGRALPKDMSGLMEGKLKMEGPAPRPEVFGTFTIKNGKIGQLDYDRCLFRFRGFPPYLPLEDSKVLRGRTTLDLEGALDLSLPNMFHGVRIQSVDKFVLWKGWVLNASSAGKDVEVEPLRGSLPKIAVKVSSNDRDKGSDTLEVKKDKKFVTVGPKIEF